MRSRRSAKNIQNPRCATPITEPNKGVVLSSGLRLDLIFDAVQQLLAPWFPEQLAVCVDAEALHAELFGRFHSCCGKLCRELRAEKVSQIKERKDRGLLIYLLLEQLGPLLSHRTAGGVRSPAVAFPSKAYQLAHSNMAPQPCLRARYKETPLGNAHSASHRTVGFVGWCCSQVDAWPE
ncbi:hypothetical protein HPB47_025531 [Ixodes persulcatus]|uniref:Uncharacterized protein n=1 Tax=Ixodes persulcatus TaxID=34615 RepID=A0AC60Q1L8_IXOPE|nr:hypothetical protein HPB47_025531 [Ixodes persulcatus]